MPCAISTELDLHVGERDPQVAFWGFLDAKAASAFNVSCASI